MRTAIIGAGPAGLMAAEALLARGVGVDIYDAMPSFGRKFLMAGKSGLNISHAEDMDVFLSRYRSDARLQDMVRAFGPAQVVTWMEALGIAAHTGPTGRVFPEMMKASPLLRAWLVRLQDAGAVLHPKHRWQGWNADGALVFDGPEGAVTAAADATVLALGGASWKRLGSDGAWVPLLEAKGAQTVPFGPSNCGFLVDWSAHMREKFAGAPVKSVRLSVDGQDTRSEFVITHRGVESGGIYTLSAALVDVLRRAGTATLLVDLLPDMDVPAVVAKLERPRGKQSMSNHLRKSLGISGVKLALLHEAARGVLPDHKVTLARLIKAVPIKVTGTAPLDEAISTTGGVAWDALDNALMLRELPGVFCAGEMIDWDAPTGGYLITACMATGKAAGEGAADWLQTASSL
ncbi:MAG: TIGR03862 family flavoprotein [Hyphomonas oceanitis]|uniref:TIGR03862 family flavoprotein n=1 Tax=Hyphomonas oceanitis TaxID=81033 RepID=UPI0030027CE5